MDIVLQAKLLMLQVGAAPVMWLMLVLSVASMGVIAERALFFASARGDFASLIQAFTGHVLREEWDAARALLESSRRFEARVVLAGLVEAPRGSTAAREAMAGASAVQRARLERRLGFLGTLGNNAPFIGLFGTVIGIIMAFDELARAGATAAATSGVMASIAEALVATAIGLFVAIPAVLAYNAFVRNIRGIGANVEALSRVLLVQLESDSARVRQSAARLNGSARGEAHVAALKVEV